MENKKIFGYLAIAIAIGLVCSFSLNESNDLIKKHSLKGFQETKGHQEHNDEIDDCLKGKIPGCINGFKEFVATLPKAEQKKAVLKLLKEIKVFDKAAANFKSIEDVEAFLKENKFVDQENKVFWNCILDAFKSCAPASTFELALDHTAFEQHEENEQCFQGKVPVCLEGFKKSVASLPAAEQKKAFMSLLKEAKAFDKAARNFKSIEDVEKFLKDNKFVDNQNKAFWNCILEGFKSCETATSFELNLDHTTFEHDEGIEECVQEKIPGCVNGFKESIASLPKTKQIKVINTVLREIQAFNKAASNFQSLDDIEKFLKENQYVDNQTKVFWNCILDAFKACDQPQTFQLEISPELFD